MLRLALRGDHAAARQIQARLRGATVECYADGRASLLDSCDAEVFLHPRPDDESVVHQCLSSGRHALLTARSWPSPTQLDGLALVARGAGVQLAILNSDRFLPSRLLLKQQVDAGKLGDPGLVRVHRWRHALASVQDSDTPVSMLRDMDTAVWLIGQAPSLVFAVEPTNGDGGAAVSRSTHVHLGFSGGGMALIDHSNDLPPGDGYQSLSLIGSKGAAHADDHQNSQLLFRGGHPQAVRVEERGRQYLSLVQHFVSALAAGRDLSPSVSSWCTVMAVAQAAGKAAACGRAVHLEGH